MMEVDDLNDFICDSINLRSYYDSPIYRGHFYLKTKFSRSKVEFVLNLVLRYISVFKKSQIVLSNLYIDGKRADLISRYEYKSQEIELFIDPLIKCGILKESPEVDMLPNKFHYISHTSEELLQSLCFVVMAMGGVMGNVFIVLGDKKKKFILYPHDDIGFGVLTVNVSDSEIKDFFSIVESNDFEVNLKK